MASDGALFPGLRNIAQRKEESLLQVEEELSGANF
jgi:hypothetical protein